MTTSKKVSKTKRGANRRPAKKRPAPASTKTPPQPEPIDVSQLPGTSEEPPGPDAYWRTITAARLQAFDPAIPAYILDANYFFLDWNAAFDELVAVPLGLRRIHSHAGDFVRELENAREVFERSKQVFAHGAAPLVDIETLIFDSAKHGGEFGVIEFQKIAAQIADASAELVAWIVYLNVSRAGSPSELWRSIGSRLSHELHWARYAISYDKLLLNFDDYSQLLSSAVAKLRDCRRCLDLGAGTGNGTLKLLQARHDREVWSIESNHAMMQQLMEKVAAAETASGRNYFGRLRAIRDDILRLGDIDALPTNHFDGAMMINVLYTLDEPEQCLREVFNLLMPGGRIVLATPHRGTDVDRLFARMREVLSSKPGQLERLRANYDDARQRHSNMMNLIHRDTEHDIRGYVEGAGFRIQSWEPAYVNAVVVVEGVKPA